MNLGQCQLLGPARASYYWRQQLEYSQLMSAQSIGDTLKKWATIIISVLSGSPSNEASVSDGSLTERDYLAIGICAGFLVMLYIFAMIVFVVIRRKQKKDRRLREQFLQVPAPEGIGFKSSR